MTNPSGEVVAKLRCPRCQSRLEVFETPSGGRVVAVTVLGDTVERQPDALESFLPADSGPSIACPACSWSFDPSGPYRTIPPLTRR
jgi:hypothetical protein